MQDANYQNRRAAVIAAENYLIQLAVRKGKPVGYEKRKPIVTLLKRPFMEDKTVLTRLFAKVDKTKAAWLRTRRTLTPKGV
jgi:transposase-like protein